MEKQKERQILRHLMSSIGVDYAVEDGPEPPDFEVRVGGSRIAVELRGYYEDEITNEGSQFMRENALKERVLFQAKKLTQDTDPSEISVSLGWHDSASPLQFPSIRRIAKEAELAQAIAALVLATRGDSGVCSFSWNPMNPQEYIGDLLARNIYHISIWRGAGDCWSNSASGWQSAASREIIAAFIASKEMKMVNAPEKYAGFDESWLLLHAPIDMFKVLTVAANWEPITTMFDRVYALNSPLFGDPVSIPVCEPISLIDPLLHDTPSQGIAVSLLTDWPSH